MKFDFDFKMNPDHVIITRLGLRVGGDAQKKLDSEVLKISESYVPHRTGELMKSGKRGTKIGQGFVVYNTPYARRMWYGKKYRFNGAPRRGAFWAIRAWADHGEGVIKAINARYKK